MVFKVPQIFVSPIFIFNGNSTFFSFACFGLLFQKIVSAKPTAGIDPMMFILETVSVTITVAYNVNLGYSGLVTCGYLFCFLSVVCGWVFVTKSR